MTAEKTALNPREIDAKLAEAIRCEVVRKHIDGKGTTDIFCGCPKGIHSSDPFHPFHRPFKPYYSAPTWETAGQLIEHLLAKGWHVDVWEMLDSTFRCRFWVGAGSAEWRHFDGEENTAPKAIAEAARLALGIEAAE